MAFELFHSYQGDAMTEGFKVFPLPRKARSDKGKPRKVKAEKPKSKGKPGRPRVYNGTIRRTVAAALRKHGYTKGLEFLRTEHKLKISLTLARSVAKEIGLTFNRGRPKVKAA